MVNKASGMKAWTQSHWPKVRMSIHQGFAKTVMLLDQSIYVLFHELRKSQYVYFGRLHLLSENYCAADIAANLSAVLEIRSAPEVVWESIQAEALYIHKLVM